MENFSTIHIRQKSFKLFDEYRIRQKWLIFEHRGIQIRTSSHSYMVHLLPVIHPSSNWAPVQNSSEPDQCITTNQITITISENEDDEDDNDDYRHCLYIVQ